MTDDPKCVAGCISFYGGERKHHKDCPYYAESLTKLNADRIEALEAEVSKAREEGRRAGLEEAAKVAEPKKKSARLKGGGWFKDTYRDKGSVTAIQVRQQVAENIRALIDKPADQVAEAATHFAVYSATGVHVGLWTEHKIAADVLGDYPGGSILHLRALAQKEGE